MCREILKYIKYSNEILIRLGNLYNFNYKCKTHYQQSGNLYTRF